MPPLLADTPLLVRLTVPPTLKIAPPPPVLLLPSSAEPVMLTGPLLNSAPPRELAELPERELWAIVSVPPLLMAPPNPARLEVTAFPDRELLVMAMTPLPLLIAPPNASLPPPLVLLPSKWSLVMEMFPPLLKIAPPEAPSAEVLVLSLRTVLLIVSVPLLLLKTAPPSEKQPNGGKQVSVVVLSLRALFVMVSVPELKTPPPTPAWPCWTVMPEMVAVTLAFTKKTSVVPPPSTASSSAPGPWTVRFVAIVIGDVSVMTGQSSPMLMVDPAAALPIAARSDPGPASWQFVTPTVEAPATWAKAMGDAPVRTAITARRSAVFIVPPLLSAQTVALLRGCSQGEQTLDECSHDDGCQRAPLYMFFA